MKVLSLFDGISAGRLALERSGVEVEKYYRSEIDKFANQVADKNYPDSVSLGDVTKWQEWDINWSEIDLLIGGSPCQGFSFAGRQAGTSAVLNGVSYLVKTRSEYLELKDRNAEFLSQSYLFWEYVLLLDHIKDARRKAWKPPVKFLLENVKMKKELLQMISDALGVPDVVINSNLVSAQNRHRHYWCNWEVVQPEDRGILLKDILEEDVDDFINPAALGRFIQPNGLPKGYGSDSTTIVKGGAIRGRYNEQGKAVQTLECNGLEKSNSLTTVQKDNVVVFNTADNPRIKGITEDERGFRPHKGDSAKSGISECGRILKPTASKADTVTTSHAPKVLVNESATKTGKSYSLTASYGGAVAWNSCQKKQRTMIPVAESIDENPNQYNGILYRKLTPLECERLQTVPDNWTECLSNTQRYKSLGNGWTIDVIVHILECAFK